MIIILHGISIDCSVRFIQAKDEQASLRAIGSMGLMAITTPALTGSSTNKIASTTNWKQEREYFIRRLEQGGLSAEFSERVADEIGSLEDLETLYRSIDDECCRSLVLAPLFEDLCKSQSHVSPRRLSHQVYCIIQSRHDAIATYCEENVYRRKVEIEIPSEYQSIFQDESRKEPEVTFYDLIDASNLDKIPTIRMRAVAGHCRSSTKLAISVVDGDEVLCYVKASLIAQRDCLKSARSAASKINEHLHQHCSETNRKYISRTSNDTKILIVCGMQPSLDRAAKMNGSRPELRVVSKSTVNEEHQDIFSAITSHF